MSDRGPTFSIVMPCYDEAETLPVTIPPLLEALEQSGLSYELVLVDNGSRDRTGEVIDGLSRSHPVRKAVVEVNQGYGFGITTGMREARGEHVVYMCPDGQVAPADVVRTLRKSAEAGPGVLVKVRRTERGDGAVRLLVSRIYNLLFLMMFGVITADVNGTPKALHRKDLERIAPRRKDWFIDAEVMIEAKRRGLRVIEVPIAFHARREGRSHVRFSTLFEFLRNMVGHRLGRR